MTDLSTRIEALFCKRWPRPNAIRVAKMANGDPCPVDGIGPYTKEYEAFSAAYTSFKAMLSCGAFESALMQFCVPDGMRVDLIWQHRAGPFATVWGETNTTLAANYGETPAEALCAALEAAWAEVEKGDGA